MKESILSLKNLLRPAVGQRESQDKRPLFQGTTILTLGLIASTKMGNAYLKWAFSEVILRDKSTWKNKAIVMEKVL